MKIDSALLFGEFRRDTDRSGLPSMGSQGYMPAKIFPCFTQPYAILPLMSDLTIQSLLEPP